jgi:hypothetical protein
VLNLDPLVDWGAVSPSDPQLLIRVNSVDDAFQKLRDRLEAVLDQEPENGKGPPCWPGRGRRRSIHMHSSLKSDTDRATRDVLVAKYKEGYGRGGTRARGRQRREIDRGLRPVNGRLARSSITWPTAR